MGLGFSLSFSFGRVTTTSRSWVCAAAPAAKPSAAAMAEIAKQKAARNAETRNRHQNSFLIAATNGQMAHSRVALSRQIENGGSAAFICAPSPARTPRRGVRSATTGNGERRSARLKCRTLQRDKNEIEMAKMLDCSGHVRHRQERRILRE